MRTSVTSVVLAALAAALGGLAYTRVPGLRLQSASTHLTGPYVTEEGWIVNQIASDVVEMVSYPAAMAPAVATSPGNNGLYLASFNQASVELDLHDDLWAPRRFVGLARAALGAQPPRAASTARPTPAVHPALLDFTATTILNAADRSTRALFLDSRDARAHEAAALILGTFALREAAGRFSDTRWALNRMTSHLALALALAEAPSIDGRLAEAVLLVLTNRQVDALAALDRLERDDRSAAVIAWTRALRLRITQDWRANGGTPAASRLEREEYVRARRATIPGANAAADLQEVQASPDAGWFRLIENSSMGVGDGRLATEALGFEQAEYREALRHTHGNPSAADEIVALNARASRFVGPDGPRVVPWGAWAEFAQRHLAMFIDRNDRFYRKLLGDAGRADAQKRLLTDRFGKLTMFPVASVWWTTGPVGAEADLSHLPAAIATAFRSPERITPAEWSFLETCNHYEPVAGGIPPPAEWFLGASVRVMQNAGARIKESGHAHSLDTIRAIMKEAPYDYGIASDYLTTTYGVKVPFAELHAVLGLRLGYDTRALAMAAQFAPSFDERLALLRTSCDVSPRQCLPLGRELATSKREAEAAVAYRRAFDSPALDAVEMASSSAWLVNYEFRNGKIASAVALAQRAAATQSWQGRNTLASLSERLGRIDEAESTYRAAADHYKDLSELLGFYYRAFMVRKEMKYGSSWTKALAQVFPQGLMPVTTTTSRPAHAVLINSDSELSRRAGLLIGDLIVGNEGYRVDNLMQYHSINAFFDGGDIKLTIWRGGALMPIAAVTPARYMGIELRSYPVTGYAEH